jgi:heat shock protein HslJ
MRRIALAVLIGAAMTILSACRATTASPELTGRPWQLTSIAESSPAFTALIPPAAQPSYVITFKDDNSYFATADCNNLVGTYVASDSKLTIKVGPSTLVACGSGSYGAIFAHALTDSSSYAIVNDVLTITLGGGGSMTFAIGGSTPPIATASAAVSASAATSPSAAPTPSPTPTPKPTPTATPTPAPTGEPTAAPSGTPAPTATPAASATPAPTPAPSGGGTGLAGTSWHLTNFTIAPLAFQGTVPATNPPLYAIQFNADGTFGAKADCNQIAGTYVSEPGGTLTLTIGPSSLVACAPGSLGDLYVFAMSQAASYATAADNLTITLTGGGTLVYTTSAAPSAAP